MTSTSENQNDYDLRCFVVMPFSETRFFKDGNEVIITSKEWDYIFDNWIKKAVESYPLKRILCKRSSTVPGNFVKGIVNDLKEFELSIADLTGSKPNVYYELGIRHALADGTIIMTQQIDSVPSDLKSYYTFGYHYSSKGFEQEGYYKNFVKSIHEKITHIVKNGFPPDSPVSDYLEKDASDKPSQIDTVEDDFSKTKPRRYFIRYGTRFKYIDADDIIYAQAYGAYCEVTLREEKITLAVNLKHFEFSLDNNKFHRVHRSYVVNLDRIKEIEGNTLYMTNNVSIPISPSYRQSLIQLFRFI